MNEISEIIKENLIRYRSLKGLSQKKLAESINMEQGNYSKIENGKITPNLHSLQKIAQALDVEIHDLLFKNSDIKRLSLLEKVKLIEKLNEKDLQNIEQVIDKVLQQSIVPQSKQKGRTIQKSPSKER